MCARYEVSRGTVRKALAQLEAERLIRTDQGIGSFVLSKHPRAVPFHFISVTDLQREKSRIRYQVLSQEVIPAEMEVAERLQLSLGTPVIHIARLRYVDEKVVAYAVRYLPEALCPTLVDQDLTTLDSIHSYLVNAAELPLLRTDMTVEAHMLTAEEAQLLRADPGDRAIYVDRKTYTAPGRLAVWYQCLSRDAYLIGFSLG